MSAFLKFADMLLTLAKALTILIVAGMVACVLMGVFFRFIIPIPVAWPPEAARFLMVAVTMIGASIAIRQMDHVGITLLIDLLPFRIRGLIYLFGNIMVAMFLVVFTWFSWRLTVEMGPRQISSSLGVSMALAYASMPIGGALMLIQLAAASIEGWQRALQNNSPFAPPPSA